MTTPCLANELHGRIEQIPVIDTHEHLPTEADRLVQPVDFFTLFSHYCAGDLVASGGVMVSKLRDPALPVEQKWAMFAPVYDRIADGSYARCAHLAMKRFYGLERLGGPQDALTLTERIRQANQPGLYRRVLKDACGIVTSLNLGECDPEFFTPVTSFGWASGLSSVCSIEGIRNVERMAGRDITFLGRYVQALADQLASEAAKGLKGLKLDHAYMRDLSFASTDTATAERLFNRIHDESQGGRSHVLGYEEARPLQDYLVHRLIEIAGDLDLTVTFHTGIQAGNDNRLDNARPGQLWNLFRRYRKVRFVLLHAGLPWVEETGILAKYFRNVYVDLAWVHAISPEIARRAVRTYVDMVPRNKVLGFGGDYLVVEKVYGHLVLARRNLAAALADKVAEGALDESRAMAWARAMLYDNVIEAYKLGIPPLSQA